MPMHEAASEEPKTKYLIGKTAGTSAAIAGFAATMIATVSGLWFPGVRLPQFDFNTLNGYLAFSGGFLGLTYSFQNPASFIVGGIIHTIDGIIWALIFGLVMHPVFGVLIKPLRPLTPTTNLIKGLIWGLALWIISSALWMPLLIGPLLAPLGVGVGPFLTSFGPYGWQALFTNLLWHTIWGVNLGLLFNPMQAGGKGMPAAATASSTGMG